LARRRSSLPLTYKLSLFLFLNKIKLFSTTLLFSVCTGFEKRESALSLIFREFQRLIPIIFTLGIGRFGGAFYHSGFGTVGA